MTVQYVTNSAGKKTGVMVSIKDWEKLLKRLNEEHVYTSFQGAAKEIKQHLEGKLQLKDARDLLNEL